MAFIPLPAGFRVAVEFNKNGQIVVNVYHVTSPLPVNTTNIDALVEIFRAWWEESLAPTSNVELQLVRIVATDIRIENGQQVILDISPPAPGELPQQGTPNQVALVASWRTGFSGRSFRGRTYFAGLQNTEIVDNDVTNVRLTALGASFASLVTRLDAGDFDLVVASYRALGVPRLTAVATPVTNVVMDSRVDTQRRRLPGSGT